MDRSFSTLVLCLGAAFAAIALIGCSEPSATHKETEATTSAAQQAPEKNRSAGDDRGYPRELLAARGRLTPVALQFPAPPAEQKLSTPGPSSEPAPRTIFQPRIQRLPAVAIGDEVVVIDRVEERPSNKNAGKDLKGKDSKRDDLKIEISEPIADIVRLPALDDSRAAQDSMATESDEQAAVNAPDDEQHHSEAPRATISGIQRESGQGNNVAFETETEATADETKKEVVDDDPSHGLQPSRWSEPDIDSPAFDSSWTESPADTTEAPRGAASQTPPELDIGESENEAIKRAASKRLSLRDDRQTPDEPAASVEDNEAISPAPRTAAPRTAAPRTGAPRTGAPRTAAPRTAAPLNDIEQTVSPSDPTGEVDSARLQRLPALPDETSAPAEGVASETTLSMPRSKNAKREPDAPPPPAVEPHVPATTGPMRAVNRRAEEAIRHAFALARRGATYSARTELIETLRMLAEALDLQAKSREHSDALKRGFRALQEAEDFQQRGLAADLDMEVLIAAHQTPVLKHSDLSNLTPLVALQRYYTYAQQQLIVAGGGQATASVALYGLGRLQTIGNEEDADEVAPQAMVFHQAALMVDPMNYKAANELGVLLARFGQYGQARDMLVHSVRVRPQPESWHNLAEVHEQLGEHELARRAAYEGKLAARHGNSVDSPVRWVEPAALAGITGPSAAAQPPAAAPEQPQPSAARNASQSQDEGLMRFIPWRRSR